MSSEEEFAELLLQNQERLHAYVFAWVRNSADAHDILQQSAILLWERFDTFDPKTSFFNWAVTVAKYTALNFLRCQRAYRSRFSNEFMDGLVAEEAFLETELEESRRAALKQCVNKLAESDRRMLMSRYENEMQVTQIAGLVGRSVSSISNSLRRIRENLLHCVKKTMERENRRQYG